MIFTTNKSLAAWGRVLHDEDLAHAIVDRVLERGRLLTLDGPSMRTKHLGLDDPTTSEASPPVARVSGIQRPEFPEPTTGLVPFNRLVWEVMRQEPYKSARRVFWIMDNGSSHRGVASDRRLSGRWPRIVPLHTPIHASWLNQIEIYFSIVQAKVLSPNDYSELSAVKRALLEFQPYYEAIAKPFEWKFTREDLKKLMARLSQKSRP